MSKKLPLEGNYIRNLIKHLRKTGVQSYQSELAMLCGAKLNSIADYVNDRSIKWDKKRVLIDSLTMTGTNPRWNKILIKKCGRSPERLRKFIEASSIRKKYFMNVEYSNAPILVRADGAELKVLDGMHRLVAAILKKKGTINAFVATVSAGKKLPYCEPHVVYDLLRPYQRGINKDKKGLVAALHFLRKSYENVDDLLRKRFGPAWLPNKEIQRIIGKAQRNR